MSTRRSPPPPTNPKPSQKGKERAAPPSRTPSRANAHNTREEEDDDAPPTSTLRARNVTGTSMREFPPSPGTPRAGERDERGGNAGGGGSWRLPGVKGTMGGIASPARSQFAPSSGSWSPAIVPNQQNQAPSRPALTFRTDPTIKSCVDTLPLDSKDEIRKLFGIS